MPPPAARNLIDRFNRDPLAVTVGICALLGPPVAYGLAVQTDRATTAIRIEDHQKQIDAQGATLAGIAAALSDIRADCAYIRGRVDAIAVPPAAPAP